MPYTSHGHPYGWVNFDAPRDAAMPKRCGGPRICKTCKAEAKAAPAEPTTEQQHAHVVLVDDEPWITCHRCGRPLLKIEDGDRLDVLVAAARQHTCPERNGEQAEGGR